MTYSSTMNNLRSIRSCCIVLPRMPNRNECHGVAHTETDTEDEDGAIAVDSGVPAVVVVTVSRGRGP